MTYESLLNAVSSSAGLRLRVRLEPMYGKEGIVFPCTVAGGDYLISPRRIPGYPASVDCAILDSVQSQANRMENALLEDIRSGQIHLPHVESDFAGIPGLEKEIGVITCFDAPHRVFDAILRDSTDERGNPFPLTDPGKEIIKASAKDATALFKISPASLLFGSWDSTGVSGGLGEKYTRCVVSEVVGINCARASRAGTRVDPLNISKDVDPNPIAREMKDPVWTQIVDKAKGKDKEKVLKKPSELNHGSVPWSAGTESLPHGGVTVDSILQSTTVSFPALRLLRFPVKGGDASREARAVLAAIAFHAAALNLEKGWHLRSRCDLVVAEGERPNWELLGGIGATPLEASAAVTRKLLLESIERARKAGLPWNDQPVRLKPSKALQKLLVDSQKKQRSSAAGE